MEKRRSVVIDGADDDDEDETEDIDAAMAAKIALEALRV